MFKARTSSQSDNLDAGFQLLDGKEAKNLDRHLPRKRSKTFAFLHDGCLVFGGVGRGSMQEVLYFYWIGFQLKKHIFLLTSSVNALKGSFHNLHEGSWLLNLFLSELKVPFLITIGQLKESFPFVYTGHSGVQEFCPKKWKSLMEP